jgi:site-specific recombinase XerD
MDIKKNWAELSKAAGFSNARVHDLRHSFASTLAGAGLSLPVIGALLGHTQAATTHRC